MKNNKGFSRFEIIVVLLVIIVVLTISFSWLFKPSSNSQLITMKRDALVFSNTVAANISAFRNTDIVYLDEVISEKLLKSIKNPYGDGDCDITESKVIFFNGKAYPTLKCGEYLIENLDSTTINNPALFKVGDWSDNIISEGNAEAKILYNCEKKGKEVFDNYYEEEYFIYKYNTKYNREITNTSEVDKKDCTIKTNYFYRIKDYLGE